ncbi:fimbrial protein [Escherichia coli]
MKNIVLFYLLSIPLFLGNTIADEININITGQIYDAPCKINNDVIFDIDFGKVSIQDIDGQKFKQTKTVEIECMNSSGIPYVNLVSSTGVLGENILNTTGVNASSLGIALYQGDAVDSNYPLKINVDKDEIKKGLSQKNFQKSNFTFTAVPYKDGNAVLTAGKFSATVTMNIFYM